MSIKYLEQVNNIDNIKLTSLDLFNLFPSVPADIALQEVEIYHIPPFLANLVLECFGKQIMSDKRVKMNRIFRYVDDMLIIYEEETDFQVLVQLWNSIQQNIKITIRKQTEKDINFLDL